jgi:hypothetical protein
MESEEELDEEEVKQLQEALKITAALLQALNCKPDDILSRKNNGTETE